MNNKRETEKKDSGVIRQNTINRGRRHIRDIEISMNKDRVKTKDSSMNKAKEIILDSSNIMIKIMMINIINNNKGKGKKDKDKRKDNKQTQTIMISIVRHTNSRGIQLTRLMKMHGDGRNIRDSNRRKIMVSTMMNTRERNRDGMSHTMKTNNKL